MVKNIFPPIVVLLFALYASFPLLHKGLPPTHDGEYHVVRFYEFNKTFLDGNWYPRWAPDLNNGYGVPLFNYVYPLPNYIASILHFLGISFIDSFKIEMFFAIIIGGIFFYLWAQEFWGKLGGVISSVFYTFSPYHFVDVYIRGSIGEVWALAFFPAFLWSITRFIKCKQKIFFLLSSVFLSLIIFSHNILALMFFFFALSYIIFLIFQEQDKKYLILNTFYIILLSLGLSSIFWLPALLEKQYVVGLQIYDFSSHFPELYQLLIPSWGSGFSGGALSSQVSFQIGIANLLVVLISLFLIVFRHSGLSRISLSKRFWMRFAYQNDGKIAIIFFFLTWFLFVFFLMLKVALPIWHIVPFMDYFQFPWRFLSVEILFASFLAGSIRQPKILAIFLILLAFFLGIGYAKPAYYHFRDDNYYVTRSNFIDGTNSLGNAFNTIYFKSLSKKQRRRAVFLEGEGEIEQKTVKSTVYAFNIKALSDSEILVNTAYFPGWETTIDRKKTKIKPTQNGLFSFSLPSGNHTVEIRFADTLVRQIGSTSFFISIFFLFLLFLRGLFARIKK